MTMPRPTEEEAEGCIRDALNLMSEARRTLTAYRFREYVNGHLPELGGSGFVRHISNLLSEPTKEERRG